ncbi:MAG: hypothetical protein ACI9MR_000734 [Myxococcota bacterium]|jgi:hypothetical protein
MSEQQPGDPRMRAEIQALIDARAFVGAFGDDEERSLLRSIDAAVRRYVPSGRFTLSCERGDAMEGIAAVVEVTLFPGPKRVERALFSLSSF